MRSIFQLYRDVIFTLRFKRCAKRADRNADRTGLRYYVLVIGGKLRVMNRYDIDNMLRQGIFARYVTRYDIQKRALYATALPKAKGGAACS